ncbi:hypothetical protein IQ254_14035 [Nodosilinea sp. LEGE 07088]|uniref:hypothetical protein n=1 Tax=Nodosilinea sp. LEGE 07088 TaxID=2777968 RepID=UPI00188288A3|nr:hypothetical protein [Nodosilinea sp. LEGE 07088]MBE9138292.1 hypothetical protein [Nodosilinea sp. LEGE 07088]
MTRSNLSFVVKVVALSGAIGVAIKYGLPRLLAESQVGQNNPPLGLVVALLLFPSVLMGGLFWLRRHSSSQT